MILFLLINVILSSACTCNVDHIKKEGVEMVNIRYLGNTEWHPDDCKCGIKLHKKPTDVGRCKSSYDGDKQIFIHGSGENNCDVVFQ